MLTVRNLCREYSRGGSWVKFLALDSVNLDVKAGEFVSIIGRSGSGKSTLLNIIAGLLSPSSGSVLLHGADLAGMSDSELSRIRSEVIGFIPQGASALPGLTVMENVLLPYALYHSDPQAETYASELLSRFGIAHLAESYPDELSGGELRRALIARALINHPEIVAADEPVSDLDVKSADEVMKIFAELNREGVTLLIVSHDLEGLKYSESVYTMTDGKLSAGNMLTKSQQ